MCWVVLDLNVLSRPRLLEPLLARAEVNFVLPDLALLEITKAEPRERGLRNALGPVAGVPTRVHVAGAVYALVGAELESGKPWSDSVLNPDGTVALRHSLAALAAGDPGEALARLHQDPDRHHEALAADHLNHTENKAQLVALLDDVRSKVDPQTLAQLRRSPLDHSLLRDTILRTEPAVLAEVLENKGMSCESRKALAADSALRRYILANLWLTLHWHAKGGLDQRTPENVTNDMLDFQYVVTATYFDDLASNDQRAKAGDVPRIVERVSYYKVAAPLTRM